MGLHEFRLTEGARLIKIRSYRDGDLEGIAALQLYVDAEMRCPPSQFSELWRWMYERSPLGDRVAVVAEDDVSGRIVGHEGIMPFQLSVDGNILRGGITGNLIVEEQYRGTLLFPRLVNALVKGYAASGFDLGYGPVRPKMHSSMLALGYRDFGALSVYVRPYDFTKILQNITASSVWRTLLRPITCAIRFAGAAIGPRPSSKIAIAPLQRFTDEHGPFIEYGCSQFSIHAVRTVEALNWRFFAAPGRTYKVYQATENGKMAGYIALRRMPMLGYDSLAIVDVLCPLGRKDVVHTLFARAHEAAVESGVAFAACMVNEQSGLVPYLRAAGFMRAPEGFRMIVHEPKGRHQLQPEMMQRWYATWFDHDYV
jgi:predicted N-acetyltransferase YhbS